MRRVVIVQRRLPHYRVPFFEALRARAAARGIEIVLVHGDPTPEEALKRDSGSLAWARHAPCRYALGGRLCWQNPSPWTGGAELVIVTPENRLLYNLWLQLGGRRRTRLGLWGHGANFQGQAGSLRERFKRQMARRTDWWFAYTAMSLAPIERSGFPRQRITVLNNAIDTRQLAEQRNALTPAASEALRADLGLVGRHVGIFVGSLYADKRIEMLLDAALRIRQAVPDFELLVVGDGPLAATVADFAQRHDWVRPLGARRGADKVAAMSLAHLMLNPGLVGLSVLDAFVCKVPMVTTDCGLHSPEIAYLEHGHNGWITADDVVAYAQAVVGLLNEPARLEQLRNGCATAAAEYTVERMAERFVAGIDDCLRSVAAPAARP